MNSGIKRQIAYKIRINDVISGEYVKKAGWEPNYVMTAVGAVSRVNVIGIVVSAASEDSFLMDDGTGYIAVRLFDSSMNVSGINTGDVVLVVGRPKEWNNEKYIVPEIIRKIESKWLVVRQLETRLQKRESVPHRAAEEPANEDIGPYQKVLNAIEKLDMGDGATVDDVVSVSKVKDAEKMITTLIEEGEIYQIRPGRLKLLG